MGSRFFIECNSKNSAIHIRADTPGLVSLAKHILELAQKDVPPGAHIHLDEFNSLEEGSAEIIIEKYDSRLND